MHFHIQMKMLYLDDLLNVLSFADNLVFAKKVVEILKSDEKYHIES